MKRIVVIGGGIVGMSCALAVQQDGHQVTVLDPGPLGHGASWASCGCIAGGEVVPLSQPKMLLQVPGWLLNPEGPLAIRPRSFLGLLPWFTRFALNSLPTRMKSIAADLATLTFDAEEDFKKLLVDIGRPELLVERPVLKLFDDDKDKAAMGATFDLARDMGCTIDEISGQEAKNMEPAIAGDFQHAAVLRDWSYVADPVVLVQRLAEAFQARGGKMIMAAARGFEREGQVVGSVKTSEGEVLPADDIILAAGTASKNLARQLGIRLHLEGLAGYSTLLPDSGVDLKHTVFYAKGGFGMTPYKNALAVAGTIEFAGLKAEPNWRRADVLVKQAHRVLPGLNPQNPEKRMGRRPFTPDTRPILGRAMGFSNLRFATGHGQLGVTLAATTGRLIADDIAGRGDPKRLHAFRPDRFNG